MPNELDNNLASAFTWNFPHNMLSWNGSWGKFNIKHSQHNSTMNWSVSYIFTFPWVMYEILSSGTLEKLTAFRWPYFSEASISFEVWRLPWYPPMKFLLCSTSTCLHPFQVRVSYYERKNSQLIISTSNLALIGTMSSLMIARSSICSCGVTFVGSMVGVHVQMYSIHIHSLQLALHLDHSPQQSTAR
jgi:hypothetical protein